MDIQAHKIARKYAKAFLNLGCKGLTVAHCEVLKRAVQEFKAHSDYITLLKIATISSCIKKKVLLTWFMALGIPVDIQRLLDVLTQHQRLCMFPAIMEELCAEFYERNNVLEFSIQASASLRQEQIESITRFLEHKTRKHIYATFVKDRGLIAGIRLQSTMYLWEYSLKQRLRNIAKIV